MRNFYLKDKSMYFYRSHCCTGQNKSHLDTVKETGPKVFSKSVY